MAYNEHGNSGSSIAAAISFPADDDVDSGVVVVMTDLSCRAIL